MNSLRKLSSYRFLTTLYFMCTIMESFLLLTLPLVVLQPLLMLH